MLVARHSQAGETSSVKELLFVEDGSKDDLDGIDVDQPVKELLVVAAGSHLVARPVKGFVEHGDDDEHLLVTIGDLFWTPCNFDHFYA